MPQKASMNNNARKYNRYNEVDERILALFAENKEKAFRLLYDTYYLPLCLYSVQFTGSAETSEDIVQNLFVSFWDKNSHTNYFLQSARMAIQCRPFLLTDQSTTGTLLFFRRNGRRILFSYR